MELRGILVEAVRRGTSDIIVSAGAPVTFHLHGELHRMDPGLPLGGEETKRLAYGMMTERQRETFERTHEMDLGFELEDVARFRANIYMQRGSVAFVLRIVPLQVPHYSEIGLSEHLVTRLLNNAPPLGSWFR